MSGSRNHNSWCVSDISSDNRSNSLICVWGAGIYLVARSQGYTDTYRHIQDCQLSSNQFLNSYSTEKKNQAGVKIDRSCTFVPLIVWEILLKRWHYFILWIIINLFRKYQEELAHFPLWYLTPQLSLSRQEDPQPLILPSLSTLIPNLGAGCILPLPFILYHQSCLLTLLPVMQQVCTKKTGFVHNCHFH